MAGLQHITITARYEPRVSYGTSLSWIAPELRDAGLALIDDHLNDPMPSRTWAGSVDGRTFERFAKSWGLPRENAVGSASKGDDGEDTAAYARTYDGMNWEVGGESPIISVSVNVGPNARLCAFRETSASAPRRGSDRTIGALRRPTRRSLSCTSSAMKLDPMPARAFASALVDEMLELDEARAVARIETSARGQRRIARTGRGTSVDTANPRRSTNV